MIDRKKLRRAFSAVVAWRHDLGNQATDRQERQFNDLADVLLFARRAHNRLKVAREKLLSANDGGQTARAVAYELLKLLED